jgi:hypothetical protein
MPNLESLATELVVQIFNSMDTIQDVVNLGATNRRLREVYASMLKLPMLMRAAERQHGPLKDAIQLVTYTTGAKPLADRCAAAVPSISLLAQINRVGRVANCWADIYPFKKWRVAFIERRELTPPERRRVRTAVYRLWLFAAAFQNPTAHPVGTITLPPHVACKQFMQHWPTQELLDMADVRSIMRDVVAQNVCPSNGAIQRKYDDYHADDPDTALGGLVFNNDTDLPLGHAFFGYTDAPPEMPVISLGSLPGAGALPARCFSVAPPSWDSKRRDVTHGTNSPRANGNGPEPTPSPVHGHVMYGRNLGEYAEVEFRWEARSLGWQGGGLGEPGDEGWGDADAHDRAVANMLKLDPGTILWLKERKWRRRYVLVWLSALGNPGWFRRTWDMCTPALREALAERDVEDVDEALGMDRGITAPEEELLEALAEGDVEDVDEALSMGRGIAAPSEEL